MNTVFQKKQVQTRGVLIQSSMEAAMGNPSPDALVSHEKAGYRIRRFVKGFVSTDAGPVPQIKTQIQSADRWSAVKARLGINRDNYKVSPGLYCVGNPDRGAEVLVTANFKLTFDHLRSALSGIDAWILVLDTRGINVWCAAGKGTFSTAELVWRIKATGLEKVVSHRNVIVPQLGATGVSATAVKKQSGFTVVYGPVRAGDIPRFLKENKKACRKMRQVTFSFVDRLVLTPVELKLILKPALVACLIAFSISGIGPGFYSLSSAGARGPVLLAFLLAGILSGAFITPVMLPFIPFKSFAGKGILTGTVIGGLVMAVFPEMVRNATAAFSLVPVTALVSSYLAMNFTGATPFTSPSGVEKEMKRFIPVQALGLLSAVVLWIYTAF